MTVYGGGIGISTNGVTIAPTGYDLKIRSNTSTLGIHTDSGSGVPTLEFGNGASGYCTIKGTAAVAMTFQTNSTEAMRITSGGRVFINTTSEAGSNDSQVTIKQNESSGFYRCLSLETVVSTNRTVQSFINTNGIVGTINTNGSATAYNTSSDYRLKQNIAPMTGALSKVAQLKPVTYKWKVDGSNGQGFIAHELQAVVPDCVSGEKDAVDKDGKPEYQGVDVSFLVATLTAAIQELKAINDTLTARIVALENR